MDKAQRLELIKRIHKQRKIVNVSVKIFKGKIVKQ